MAGRSSERRTTFWWSRRGRFVQVFLLLVALLGFLAVAAAWPWHVAPPPPPENSAVVFLADYGWHSRLAMEVDRSLLVEYSFGDWRYFAVGEDTFWRGLVALTVPTQAALGRRYLGFVDDDHGFNRAAGSVRSVRIEVERAKLEELLAALNSRYQAQLATEIEADWTEMSLVKDARSYHLLQNSNHQTATWLRNLGCDVGRFPILSNFRVRQGRE